jgi:hypothetical protein
MYAYVMGMSRIYQQRGIYIIEPFKIPPISLY